MLKKLKDKILKPIWNFLRHKVFVKSNIVPAILGELTFWSPLLIFAFLAIFVSPMYWFTFGAIYFVWVVILPAIPIQLLFIFLWAKLLNKLKRRKK